MTITREEILRICSGVYRKNLDSFVRDFNRWAAEFGVTTPLRAAHFIGQVLHESGCLRYTEEIASGKAYEWRQDLGNVYKGDGVRFKGRGYIQLTGRTNYVNFNASDCCTEDVVAHPEKVAKFPLNQIASMWFWERNGLSAIADQDNGQNTAEVCKKVTKRVNGGLNGYSERFYYLRRFKKEFGI